MTVANTGIAVLLCIPLLMNFLTLTTTFTFASPSDERGLSIISMAG
jgi:hypothetical protein